MTKRVNLEFDEPVQQPAEQKKAARSSSWVTRGVNLRADELQQLDAIARAEGVTRNGLMRYAILEFMKSYSSGLVNLPTAERERAHTPTKKIIID